MLSVLIFDFPMSKIVLNVFRRAFSERRDRSNVIAVLIQRIVSKRDDLLLYHTNYTICC